MLDETHVDVAGQEGELDRSSSAKVQPLPPQPVVMARSRPPRLFRAATSVLIFIKLGKSFAISCDAVTLVRLFSWG